MTALTWDTVGKRYFETGIDRGVLYVGVNPGVVWSGLISLSESPSGGDATGYYIDGVKHLNSSAPSEFQGTLTAYSSPVEFAPCEGITFYGGLTLVDQPRRSFGLSYRTSVGNDIDGIEHGYKIHLVYNARAGVASKDYTTLGDKTDPIAFSWPITAKPIIISGVRPTAHLIIDSLTTPEADLITLEHILYGDVGSDPRMPTVDELAALFDLTYTPPSIDDILDGGSPSGTSTSFVDGGG